MRLAAWVMIVGLLLCCSGCAVHDPSAVVSTGPGFFTGVWHGLIAPFALIGYMFDHSIAFYQSRNAGVSYDVGFFIGIAWLRSLT